jgi:hypothetical protein
MNNNFWIEKTPCWVLRDCSKYVCSQCPASIHADEACWNQAYTQSEKLLGFKRECTSCKVFQAYGSLKLKPPSP